MAIVVFLPNIDVPVNLCFTANEIKMDVVPIEGDNIELTRAGQKEEMRWFVQNRTYNMGENKWYLVLNIESL